MNVSKAYYENGCKFYFNGTGEIIALRNWIKNHLTNYNCSSSFVIKLIIKYNFIISRLLLYLHLVIVVVVVVVMNDCNTLFVGRQHPTTTALLQQLYKYNNTIKKTR